MRPEAFPSDTTVTNRLLQMPAGVNGRTFYSSMVGATIISVVCLITAMASYVSLSMSDAREDESGERPAQLQLSH